MSTKATIYGGTDFHFYEECLGSGSVYLTMHRCKSCYQEQTVEIPIAVWEVIRNFSKMPEIACLAGMTDDDIRADAEEGVRERIQAVEHRGGAFSKMYGSLKYGPYDLHEFDQVENGVKWLKKERTRARQIMEEFSKNMKETLSEG